MNSVKSIVATMVLLGIGYGANFFMHQPSSDMAMDNAWGTHTPINVSPNDNRPQIELPPLQPATTVPRSEADGLIADTSNTSAASNPFAGGADPTSSIEIPPSSGGIAGGPSIPPLSQEQEDAFPINPSIEQTPPPYRNSIAVNPVKMDPPESFVPPPSTLPIESPAPSTGLPPVSQAALTPGSEFNSVPVAPVSHLQPIPSDEFNTAWAQAQSFLDAGDLGGASTTLTGLYRSSLSSQDRDRVVTILDQLAGTAIYSGESFLFPAHTVGPQETLATIAQSYQVPEEFLKRVNSLSSNASATAGQPVKVVRGPFRAELDVTRREMTVYLGDHYAGRFNVAIGRDFPAGVTAFVVTEKTGPRGYQDMRTGQMIAAGAANNPIGEFWLGLQANPSGTYANLGIHSVGDSVTASDSRGCLSVSQADAADLQAILSVGSQITVKN